MSSMGALTTALSALYAQRRGLDVTGHNIANANTDGYTRQRVELSGNAGPVSPAIYSRWNGVGQGVSVDGVSRLRDAFLELRSNQEHGVLGQLTTMQYVLGRVELGYGEPGELGIAAQLNDFFAGWGDIANNPTDVAARRALLERASTLAFNLRGTYEALNALRGDIVGQVQAQTQAVNNMAAAIAELNDNIAVNTNAGLSTADLLDQRDLMVSQLAGMIGINVKPSANGGVDVFVGGTALVRGNVAEKLQVEDSPGSPRTVSVSWAKDGYPATVSGGSIGGLLNGANHVIDGESGQLAKLDAIANSLREMVNDVHSGGKDLYGDVPSIDFFTGTGAADIRVSQEYFDDPRLVAAASGDGGYADAGNALALAALAGRPDGPDGAYRAMIVELGVQLQTVNRRVGIQSEVTRQIDAAREGQAGVNLDEEMTNMLAYQRAYEAAARFMTSIDQMLDQLINRTGLVGR
jgi:flagellar hook-associated protein 1